MGSTFIEQLAVFLELSVLLRTAISAGAQLVFPCPAEVAHNLARRHSYLCICFELIITRPSFYYLMAPAHLL